MAKSRQQKEEILNRLENGLGSAASVTFVQFTNVPVAEESALRRKFKNEGISYFVAKKTLIKKALGNTEVSGDIPSLDGEIAVAYNAADGDPTAPARTAHAISKELTPERFSIVGGIFEKHYKSKAEMTEIASIPSIDVLRGMFVNAINSPIAGFAMILNAYAEKKSA
jgi:large subunit ribosomal protein L10